LTIDFATDLLILERLGSMLLVLKNVRKSFLEPNGRRLDILNIPEFSVSEGEQMVLVGRSGCGKSTLLHVIAGIRTASAGSVLIDGINITKLSEQGRDRLRAAKIGYVFQTFNLLAAFTALENVLLGMTFARGKRSRRRALELLDRVGLSERAHHKPAALSVGEQQRVAVARALANQPRLLLADEPTANIDPANQDRIIDLIRATCEEENIGLVMVTHSMEVAGRFARVDKLEEINQLPIPATAS
jgi:ABC-type lipoprotein export system ATPase subunit